MSVHIDIVKKFYDDRGSHYNTKTIENCFSSTAKAYAMSSENVYSIISPYFYDIPSSNKHVLDECIPDIMALTHASDDFTDISIGYNEHADDQAKNIVPYNEQTYLSTDFRKKVIHRFPIFDEKSYIPHKYANLKYYQAQKQIRQLLPNLEGFNWTNQTLSYARGNIVGKHIIQCIVYPLYKKGLFGDQLKVVDATGNIGADSILFAMEKFVESVKVYEILPNVYNMLVRNIDLYGMKKKINAINKKFDYNVSKGSLVMIDPPYEADNNRGNFNLSIDAMPIYYVTEQILNAGAMCVLLSMPKTYKYNTKFALDHQQHVSVYQMGRINNKMFLVMRQQDAKRIGLIDFNYTLVTTDETQKNWNGSIDAYKCKSDSRFINDNKNPGFVQTQNPEDNMKYCLTLPEDIQLDKNGSLPKSIQKTIFDEH